MNQSLNEQHQALSQRHQSGLMTRFSALPMDTKIGAIALSATIGLTCGALAWTGKASDRIYFCLTRPDLSLQCQDEHNRFYRMTPFHWQEWKNSGMPSEVVPNETVGNAKGIVAATNPYKPFWALSAFIGFAATGYMLRHLQSEETRLAAFDDMAHRRDEAVADMNARVDVLNAYRAVAVRQAELEADVDLVRYDALIQAEQVQVLGEAEIEVARLEAEDAKFEAQTAGMTEEQRQEYIEFLRQQKTPFQMNGLTLEKVNNPSDKVQGNQSESSAAIASSPVTEDELLFEITRLNPSDATKGKNVMIVAGQGVGKTTLALYIAGAILQSPDIQVYDLDDDRKTWGNLPVWGTGDDASEIAGAMQADKDLFEHRTKQRITGERLPFAVRILDETPSTVQQIPKPFAEWAFMMTSRARKRALIGVLLTQFRDPELNGIKPDQWRTAFATFYLGFKQVSHALNYLVKPKDLADRLRAALTTCKRPCLVAFEDGWYWYDVPDLEAWKHEFLAKTHTKINPASDTQLGLTPTEDLPPFPPVTPEIMGNDVRQRLEFLFDFHLPPPEKELSDAAIAILAYARRKGTVTARDCLAGVKALRGKSSEQVRDLFQWLERSGKGVLTGEGATLAFTAHPQETDSA